MPAPVRLLVCLVLLAPFARGQNLLLNGGFESGTNPPAANNYVVVGTGGSALTGWSVVSTGSQNVTWLNSALTTSPANPAWNLGPSEGSLYIDLTGIDDHSPTAGIAQTFTTTIGQMYRVSFDLGTGSLESGGPVTVQATAGPASFSFTNASTTSNWTNYIFDFTAAATSSALTIAGTSVPSGGVYLGIDQASVIAIPEPSWSAFLLGATALGCWRRRRKR